MNPDHHVRAGGLLRHARRLVQRLPAGRRRQYQSHHRHRLVRCHVHTVTLTPTSPLSTSSIYTVLVKGGSRWRAGHVGQSRLRPMSAATFLTPAQPASVWSNIWAEPDRAWQQSTVGDASRSNSARSSSPDVSGNISGVRFYKAAGNTGVHTGSLWTSSGQLLATATFVNETASGWQDCLLSRRRWPITRRRDVCRLVPYRRRAFLRQSKLLYRANSTAARCTCRPTAACTSMAPAAFPTQASSASNYWVDVMLRSRRR